MERHREAHPGRAADATQIDQAHRDGDHGADHKRHQYTELRPHPATEADERHRDHNDCGSQRQILRIGERRGGRVVSDDQSSRDTDQRDADDCEDDAGDQGWEVSDDFGERDGQGYADHATDQHGPYTACRPYSLAIRIIGVSPANVAPQTIGRRTPATLPTPRL